MANNQKIWSLLGILISIASGLIAIIFQSQEPQTGIAFFIALLLAVLAYFVISYIVEIMIGKNRQINENTKRIESTEKALNNITRQLDLNLEIAKLNAKITSIIEELNKMKGKKRGQVVDPRMVVAVIILILLYFYLKSKGVI